jgi:translation initiation factor IF-3
MNERIRVTPIRVIDQNQQQLGIISTAEALSLAREAGLDLVEVSPMEKPPVCRIMDYGKFKYDRKKRQKASSQAHVISIKEIRIRPKTDTHDREIKMNRAKQFLADGNKVQFTMLFRGRERFHRERAQEIFDAIIAELGETAKIERHAAMEGRRMTLLVAPTKTKQGSKPAEKQGSKAAEKQAGRPVEKQDSTAAQPS